MRTKNCILVWIPALILLFSNCNTAEKNDASYIKSVHFERDAPLDEKVRASAHVIPTAKQLEWQRLEMTAFLHFTVNTFTDLEWGHGDESPEIFNPTELDAEQWVSTLKNAGMKLVILTCKHHDGFCLWPTKTTAHSVASSPWKSGKGDVVKAVKEACDKYGVKFGVYLSPWDRNAPVYGDSPKYNRFFMDQLTELLTWYGKVDEVWFDGANGEGPNGKKQVYDWDAYYDLIAKLQPEALVAIVGEDIRWVGTESGYGRETEWSVTTLAPGGRDSMHAINEELQINAMSEDLGSRHLIEKAEHLFWFPAEVDVSIRPGWFYHKSQDNHVKSLAKMVDIYFSSVGRNAVLLLNVPPDKRGKIHEADSTRLMELRSYLDKTFDTNVLAGASTVPKDAAALLDNDMNRYWNAGTETNTATCSLDSEKSFNVLMVQEAIQKGQHVESFKIEALIDGAWKQLAESTTIGYKKLLRIPKVKTDRVRLTIAKSRGPALISQFGLYLAPELLSDPIIRRNKEGLVTIETETPYPVITYTLDDTEPTRNSPVYNAPIPMEHGGIVKARAFINQLEEFGDVVSEAYDLSPVKWKVLNYDIEDPDHPAKNAIDGDNHTMWHTPWTGDAKNHPHHIAIDMTDTLRLKGFTYTPRAGTNKSGTVLRYDFLISVDGVNWSRVISIGSFSNMKNNPIKQWVYFQEEYKARFIKFITLEGIRDEPWASVGEIGVITR